MSRTFVFAGALLAVSCLTLAGCNWDSALGHYDDYQAFTASKDFKDPLMPTALIPKSARAIEFKLVTDMNEATVDFDFAPADRAAMLAGFAPMPPADKARIDADLWFKQPDAGASLYLRCSAETVEFLAVGKANHAHYQSSQYPEQRDPYCASAKPASPA